ncbi:MAG TPA: hypothetical protein PK335_07160 [Draconibacterium sp.]|nr:hypothetical protein [Draconibacterium sp.]
MYKTIRKYGCLIALAGMLGSCAEKPVKEPVARVGERYLYRSDLLGILPSGYSKEDSIIITDDYISRWVKQELMIQKANENLTASQKDVSKELDEYRNSLIIYRYKNELIKQRMDTVVTQEQIENYYENNKNNFNLDHCIVKAVFVKIPTELANPSLLREMAKDDSKEGQDELRDYCTQYAKSYQISLDSWIDFQVLNRNLPEHVDDPEAFVRLNREKEMNDSNYYYLVSIHDYMLANDLAPIEFVENNIKNLILNQRKIKFLKQLEDNVYTEAERQNKFSIYDDSDEQ